MNKNIKPINENERNIDWDNVEYKISIICNKFRNIDARYKDDLAQELRIHAFYFSDDYYDLTRKAIDFWRTLQVRVMPEVPYIDLELIGGMKYDDFKDVDFSNFVEKIHDEISNSSKKEDEEVRLLAIDIFDVIVDEIVDRGTTVKIREFKKYRPYHNKRISCSYLWEVMGEEVGSINYRKIRKAMKFIEETIIELAKRGEIIIDETYME